MNLIEAFKTIGDLANLTIAGNGESREMVGKLSKIVGFTYLGPVSEEVLSKLYSESDILVVPTMCDIFPLTVLEGASSGLYVIASAHLRGIFDDLQNNGFLCYTNPDPDSLAQTLRQVIRNYDRKTFDRIKEHNYIKEKYSWSKIRESLYEYLDGIS